MIKKEKRGEKGIVPTEMQLPLEETQQGTSHEVSVSTERVEELKIKVKIKGEKKEALLTPRTASKAMKPCQGYSLEFYLITGNPDSHSYWIKTSQDSMPLAHA
nr:hypothetical protein [Tanacetum cinerariifolium]